MELINRMLQKYDDWLYIQRHKGFGLLAFLLCLKDWLAHHPTIARCPNCGDRVWHNGQPVGFVYCNEYCAMYGPFIDGDEFLDDVIPF